MLDIKSRFMAYQTFMYLLFFQLDLKLLQLIFFANEDQAASNNKKQRTHAESITERRSKLGLDIKMILYILEIVLSLTVLIITLVKLPEELLNTKIEKKYHIYLSKLMNDNIKLQRGKMLKLLEEA